MPYSRSIFDDDEHENHVGHPKMAAIHARLAEYQVYFGTVWDRFPEAKDLCEKFAAPVWRVSWSVTGNLLAVSCGDHTVTLWKQSLSGDWTKVSDVTDDGAQEEKAN